MKKQIVVDTKFLVLYILLVKLESKLKERCFFVLFCAFCYKRLTIPFTVQGDGVTYFVFK